MVACDAEVALTFLSFINKKTLKIKDRLRHIYPKLYIWEFNKDLSTINTNPI